MYTTLYPFPAAVLTAARALNPVFGLSPAPLGAGVIAQRLQQRRVAVENSVTAVRLGPNAPLARRMSHSGRTVFSPRFRYFSRQIAKTPAQSR